jgi:hypothetical protein
LAPSEPIVDAEPKTHSTPTGVLRQGDRPLDVHEAHRERLLERGVDESQATGDRRQPVGQQPSRPLIVDSIA